MKFLLVALSLMAALAANADAPDQNVDKRNDAGGSTGNDQVDRLNKGQLDQNQHPAPASQDPPPANPNNSSDRPKSAQATKHLGQRFHCKKLHQTTHSHSCERYQRLGFDRAFLVNNAG